MLKESTLPGRLRTNKRLCATMLWVKTNIAILLLTACTMAWALLPVLNNAEVCYDDVYLFWSFDKHQVNHNVVESALYFGFPLDLKGEYRTYGLSRLVQFSGWYLFGANPVPFHIFTIISQMAAAILVYKIARLLRITPEIAFFTALVWFCNPFCFPQVFHYFSYLLLPGYLILGYTWLCLKRLMGGGGVNCTVASEALILPILFTGEATLPVFFWIVTLFLTFSIRRKSYDSAIRFVIHLAASLLVLIVHHHLHATFVMRNDGSQRFHPGLPTINLAWERFTNFLSSIGTISVETIFTLVFEGTTLKNEQHLPVITAAVGGVILLSLLACQVCRKSEFRPPSTGSMLLSCTFVAASLMLYAIMAMSDVHFGMVSRYLMLPATIFLSAAVVFVYWFIGRRWIARGICLVAGVVFILFASVHYYSSLSNMRAWEEKVTSQVNQARREGKVAVLIANTNAGTRTPLPELKNLGMLDQRSYSTQTSFAPFWMIEWYMKIRAGFTFVACSFDELEDGTIRLINPRGQTAIYNKNDIFALGTRDLEYFSPHRNEIPVRAFLKWEDFRNSSQYYGVDLYSQTGTGKSGRLPLGSRSIAAVDLGELVPASAPFLRDQMFSRGNADFDYGVTAGHNAFNAASRDAFSPYFTTVRYGNFSYGFKGLEKQEMTLVLDLQEMWHSEAGKRVFDIIIQTDSTSFKVEHVDPFKLGGRMPLTLAIHLPETTTVSISLIRNAASADVAFLSGIRLQKLTGRVALNKVSDVARKSKRATQAQIAGHHDRGSNDSIQGWAWDASTPSEILIVDIYADGIPIETVMAGKFREDLKRAGIGSGNHSFSIPVPLVIRDGKPHLISLKVAGTDVLLRGSPVTFTYHP